jgi:hypothetical protein
MKRGLGLMIMLGLVLVGLVVLGSLRWFVRAMLASSRSRPRLSIGL